VFRAPADGDTTMPGKTWGMLTDNFHTRRIINGETVPF
jgi:hypothetical protein